ncbi:unnamed protein product [Ixodes pacificus]
MWAGARATYGVLKGKVCYETKITKYQDVSHLPSDEPTPNVARVGFSTESTSMQLGEEPLSYGYGGTGKISVDCKFKDYGESFGEGDVILGLVDMDSDPVRMSFAKNGKDLGVAFQVAKATLAGQALFPHVLSKNCSFEVNFGQKEAPWFPLPKAYQDYSFLGCVPLDERLRGVLGPKKKADCEMIMMCGLPGCGKTTWANEYSQKQPERKYNILGTNNIIDKMKVMGLPRKRNYSGRWDVLIDKSTKCLNKLLELASKTPRNYILDQVGFTSCRTDLAGRLWDVCRTIYLAFLVLFQRPIRQSLQVLVWRSIDVRAADLCGRKCANVVLISLCHDRLLDYGRVW